MKRVNRTEKVTPEQAAKYNAIRQQIAEELPELLERHEQRQAAKTQLDEVLQQLKAAREAQGLSLADVMERTGMDRSALSKLENGQRENPTIETLARYAEAVGKKLVVQLQDAC